MRPPQGMEWVILLVIVLLLFGARRLPDLARSVGRSMKIFKSEVKDFRTDGDPAEPQEATSADDDAPLTPSDPTASGPTSGNRASPADTPPEAASTSTRRTDDGERPVP